MRTRIYSTFIVIVTILAGISSADTSNGLAPEVTDLNAADVSYAKEKELPYLAKPFISTAPQDKKDSIPVGELGIEGGDKNMILKFADEIAKASDDQHRTDSLLISYKGKLIFESYYRRGRANYPHYQMSITKSYTALALGRAIQLGHFSMEGLYKPAISFLKDLDRSKLVKGAETITLDNAMHMGSGIRVPKERVQEIMQNQAQLKGQGQIQAYLQHSDPIPTEDIQFKYQASDPALTMQVVDAVVPGSAKDFIHKELLGKLGITNYGWQSDISALPKSAAGSSMRSRDMLKFGMLVMNGGKWKGEQLIPEEYIKRAISPLALSYGTSYYGYFWWVDTSDHNGRSYTYPAGRGAGGQFMLMFPELELIAVITAHNKGMGTMLKDVPEMLLKAFVKNDDVGVEDDTPPISARKTRTREGLRPRSPIPIMDFEKGYGDWTVKGEAFGDKPATGSLPRQQAISGWQGKSFVNTFVKMDKSTGTLTSPIKVERDYIVFLIGGGMSDQTTVQLLVNGRVVQSVSGMNSEEMVPGMFSTKLLRGKEVQIRITDKNTGGWGHILADDFIMTDQRPANQPQPMSRKMQISGKYLLIPISKKAANNSRKGQLEIYAGSTLAHRMDVHVADGLDDIDWWAYAPMEEYVGKTATLKYTMLEDSRALEMIESSDTLRHLQPLYNESVRPQLRFSQMRGWNNDPNGMLYYDGEYHLFFQSNPFATYHSNMYWGHAVSKDLVHWKELPWAMRPFGNNDTDRHPSMSKGKCFSGGGCVDFNNTLGLQKDDTKTLVATFTDTSCGESIAYSTDKGRTWKYHQEINPIIKHPGRDPKPFWYEPTQHWVIAVFDGDKQRGGQNISFYISKDMKSWEYTSHVPGYFECPEFFELPVSGEKAKRRWVLMGANAQYQIGTFDGRTFKPEHEEKRETIVGRIFNAIYAGQCFSNAPDGRMIYIGWAGMTNNADHGNPFHHGFTLPIELTLRNTKEGIRLFAEPVKEINMLRDGVAFDSSGKSLKGGDAKLAFKTDEQLFDILVKVSSPSKDGKATLKIGESAIPIDLTADDPKWQFAPASDEVGTAVLRVIVDRPFMEVCSANGRRYQMINRADKGRPLGKISLACSAGEVKVEQFKMFKMRSIWR